MIIVSGGIKGGSGKSTVAVNLAVMLAQEGREVLLVDADDQESAMDFTILRNDQMEEEAGYTCITLRGKAIRTEVLRLVPKYDDVVIDCGGRDTTNQRAALSVADVYLVPFVPRSFDVWTLEKVSELVEDIQTINEELKPFIFLNRADHQGHDNEDAVEYFAEYDNLVFLDAPLGNRKAFANAAAQGKGVVEFRPKDLKAIAEVEKLFEKVRAIEVTS